MDYKKGDGNLPCMYVQGESIPEAWENSVLALYDKGLWYQRGGRKDKGNLQTDSTMMIEVTNPLSNLFMHRGMNCQWKDLFEYQMEILGAKDSWVDNFQAKKFLIIYALLNLKFIELILIELEI